MSQEPLSRQAERRALMLDTPIPGLVLKMALPTVVALVITAVYNMADTYFVSSLGTAATGAVGINYSLDQIILMGGSFLAIGANSYIARLLGAKQEEKASAVLSTAFFTAFITGSIIMILGILFKEPMLRLMGATDSVVPYAMEFASYVLYTAPFMAANFVLNQCLRSEGSAIYSMLGMLFGAILNIILDPILIFHFNLGVTGASIATAIAKLTTFVILILPYLRRRTLLQISLRKITYSRDIVTEVVRMGSSSLFRLALSAAATIFINNLAGRYSDSALAAISVVGKVMLFLSNAIIGFGQGFQPVAGYNWGARRYDRVLGTFRFSAVFGLASISVLSLLMGIFAKEVLLQFTEHDASMIAIGVYSLRIQCVAMPLQAFGVVVNMLYAGLGKARGATVLSLSRQGFCFFPILLLLPSLFGIMGVASVQAAADALSLAVTLPFAFAVGRDIRQRMATDNAPLDSAQDLPGTPAVHELKKKEVG